MKNRIKELEEQLGRLSSGFPAQSHPRTAISSILTDNSYITGAFHVHQEARFPGDASVISRGVTHKARLFGQSHWINGITVVSICAPSWVTCGSCLTYS